MKIVSPTQNIMVNKVSWPRYILNLTAITLLWSIDCDSDTRFLYMYPVWIMVQLLADVLWFSSPFPVEFQGQCLQNPYLLTYYWLYFQLIQYCIIDVVHKIIIYWSIRHRLVVSYDK